MEKVKGSKVIHRNNGTVWHPSFRKIIPALENDGPQPVRDVFYEVLEEHGAETVADLHNIFRVPLAGTIEDIEKNRPDLIDFSDELRALNESN